MLELAPVLLAEDCEHDVFFLQRAFTDCRIANPLIHVPDGREAIYYLDGAGAYADRARYPFPCLLLLDIKMPIVNGFEVLSWIMKHPPVRERLPVVVLSSSTLEVDERRAYDLGARDVLGKPFEYSGLVQLMNELDARWLKPLQAVGHSGPSSANS